VWLHFRMRFLTSLFEILMLLPQRLDTRRKRD
jgi:hypothetical protein